MADGPTLSLVAQEVRRHDPDRFLTALFAPPGERESVFALYALNSEIARVAETVSEPLIGMMRLQWWRDRLADIYDGSGAPAGHPVAEAVEVAIRQHDLPREQFERMIDARENDLDSEAIPDRESLTVYAEGTGGTVAVLVRHALNGAPSASALEATKNVGTAYALAGILRAAVFHAHHGRTYLPVEELANRGTSVEAVMERRVDAGIRAVVEDIAAEAVRLIGAARTLDPRPGRHSVAAQLPAVLAEGYLARLRAVGHDPFDPRLSLPHRRPVVLAMKAFFGRY